MRAAPRSVEATSFHALIEAARDSSPVTGLTHNFYRYPARFSPKFVRAAIEAFSARGDLVLDPFAGGGTTLVEALALGRHAVGIDISSLAAFISEVKTALYSDSDLRQFARWAAKVPGEVNIHAKAPSFSEYSEAGYLRYLGGRTTWRLRKAIEQALGSVIRLSPNKLELLGRCVVLRAAQWALDGRKNLPSISEFRTTLSSFATSMIEGAREFRQEVERGWGSSTPISRCLTRSTAGLEAEPDLTELPKPRLILTSPPYPGVHVLYHRWQVDGRKETPAPFWIANKLDGSGAAYYTMGDRNAYQLNTYFNQLAESLSSIAAMCTDRTTVVQVVAFSQPKWQLPRYLSAADDAGLAEFRLPTLKEQGDCRLWRTVPNRKWYADQRGETNGSQEVVLFHRKR
jgi:hypothetical protein